MATFVVNNDLIQCYFLFRMHIMIPDGALELSLIVTGTRPNLIKAICEPQIVPWLPETLRSIYNYYRTLREFPLCTLF